ncbi:hypothetical protein NliqN6_0211 [Naganishia liquefaciens]|uniref:Large ribosomal subunit protein mL59 domain-containing protein n=1 Tax=Naganishia liquefaciens TaxID=104408 RepID=A0A8H3TP80_9TREE|nr:hypothetical protein NliqN6_0211 [Naganishia liquefaciens]
MRTSRTLLNTLSGFESVAAAGSSTPGKFLPPVFNRIVIDAAVSQPSSTLSAQPTSEDASAVTTVRAPNPFIGHKNPQTGRHAPARISLRCQADLAKVYPSDYLPAGPKTQRNASASEEATETIQYEEDRLAVEWVGTAGRQMSARARRRSSEESTTKADTPITLRSGPYQGRQHQPKLFKGHKHDRQRIERREETKSRMEGMEGRLADWRKSKLDAIATAKPSLPF